MQCLLWSNSLLFGIPSGDFQHKNCSVDVVLLSPVPRLLAVVGVVLSYFKHILRVRLFSEQVVIPRHVLLVTSRSTNIRGEVLKEVLGLEASSPPKLPCPRLEDSTIFWIVKILQIAWKKILMTFFMEITWKKIWRPFFLENTCACVLGPRPRAFLSLTSRGSVLGRAVLGYGIFLCPWPRALCPRLHL